MESYFTTNQNPAESYVLEGRDFISSEKKNKDSFKLVKNRSSFIHAGLPKSRALSLT
jgi:hypothetical protein